MISGYPDIMIISISIIPPLRSIKEVIRVQLQNENCQHNQMIPSVVGCMGSRNNNAI